MSSNPFDPTQPVVVSTQPKPDKESLPGWAKVGLVVGGALLLGTALDALFSSSRSGKERRSPRLPSVPRSALPGEQLATNRKRGKQFENVVGERLQDTFPNATVIPQLTVNTPEGKRRRLDFAVAHNNGSVTPIEVKNVPELKEKHVKQAEDHRAGLKHTLNVRAGLPIVAVPEDTIVSDEHEGRLRVMRVPTMTSKSGRRKR